MIKTLATRDLGSETQCVDANVVWRAMGQDIPADRWWGIPVWQVRMIIDEMLREGRYREAGLWSALITPAPVAEPEPEPVIICSHPLSAGERLRRREPHLADVILLHRMQRSRQAFGRAFAPHCRRWRILPLV